MPFIAPIIGAISAFAASAASFVAGLGIVGKALIGIGLNIVATIIQRAITPKNKEVTGVQFERQYGATVPRQVAIGMVGIAGHDCYVNTYEVANERIQQIYALSDFYTTGLSRLAINGKYVQLRTYDDELGMTVASGDFENRIFIKFYDGRQQLADVGLIIRSNPFGRWGETGVGLGVSYVKITMQFDKERNAQFPDFFFELQGAPLYDWRKDDTVPGGAGGHRWADPATWEFSENPIVAEYNYRRGLSVNGDMFCGMEMSPNDLPLDKWTVAANICDEDVDGEPRYRLSLMVDCSATHKTNIEAISLACGSMVVDSVAGSWPLVGSEQPIAMVFTDDDLIGTQPVKYRAKRSMNQLVNSVGGQFPDPEQLWSMTGYETQVATAYLALDRRTRDISISFPQVRSARQAEQLAHIYLYENRHEATATLTLRPKFQVLEVGDWVQWNSARYGSRTYIVQSTHLISVDEENPRCMTISIQERDGVIYDGITPSVPVVPVPPGQAVYLEQLDNFHIAPVIVIGDTGAEQAAFRLSWNMVVDPTVESIVFQYWSTAEPANIITKQLPPDQLTLIITEGIVGATEYAIRHRIVPNIPRVTNWSVPVLATSPNVTSDFFPIDLDDLAEDVTNVLQWFGDGRREFEMKLQEIDVRIASFALSGKGEIRTVREQVTATFDFARSDYTKQITVLASETEAIASSVETLTSELTSVEMQVTGNATAISGLVTSVTLQGEEITTLAAQYVSLNTVVTTHTGQIAGQATALSGLSTQVTQVDGKVTASAEAITSLSAASTSGVVTTANSRMQVVSGTAGYSRIGWETRVGGAGAWRGAAMWMETPNNAALPSRVIVAANQFMVLDPSLSLKNMLLWQAGTLYLGGGIRAKWAQIDEVVIGWADIGTAVVNNFVAQSANIANLSVDTLKLRGDAISASASDVGPNTTFTTGWVSVASVWLQVPSDAQYVDCLLLVSGVTSSTPYQFLDARLVVDGSNIVGTIYRHPLVSGPSTQLSIRWMTPTGGAKNFRFDLKMSVDSDGANISTIGPIMHARAFRR